MDDAFYEPAAGGSFVATPLTRGPWDEGSQHAGPPSALLARAIETQLPPDFRMARLSVDILRPIPIGRLTPRATIRQGKRVARAQLVLDADGTEVVTGTAVAQRVADLDLPTTGRPGVPLAAPE